MSGLNGINEGAFNYYPWNRLLQYVDDHYSEHISLSEAAQISGLQMSSFCAFFAQRQESTSLTGYVKSELRRR